MAAIEELLPRPSVMGVVNVTPDSFSDGGAFLHPQAAIAEANASANGIREQVQQVDPPVDPSADA